ncbi:helix-turn-helix domain-containing protein [Streptomyces sp. NPDC049954]|uniref:PucR family transcriptional regulator n=1 Tax=Streptomyces sp. NPDC049954 TaxID=3155779 RepID=UPI0034450B32
MHGAGEGHREAGGTQPPGTTPGAVGGHWLRRLVPDRAARELVPASSPETIAATTACLGPEPVAWAVGVGHAMAVDIMRRVPELGPGEGPFQTLRMGTESATLRALLLLHDPAAAGPVTDEALQGDRDFVRRGIALDKVLRGIRLGHAEMVHALLAACERLAPPDRRAEEMRQLSDTLFDFIDGFSSRMTEEYLAEHDRWITSSAAARQETVRSILAGDPLDAEAAARVLGYPLTAEHLAITAWCDPAAGPETGELQHHAVEFLRGRGCTTTLVVPTGRTGLWAWGAPPAEGPSPDVTAPGPEWFHLACGAPGLGVAGFRQSHEQALRAARVAGLNPRPGGGVTDYGEVEVVALMSNDLPAVRQFVHSELGPLAEDTSHAEQLRETLRHYLAGERSLLTAAAHMHVARNTVTYRVKRAQQLLGHDISHRRFEVHAALAAAHVLGPAVLRPAAGSPHTTGRPPATRLRSAE